MIYDEKSQENGYISFTPSSIKEMIDNGGENLQAYQWLYKAMTIYEKRSGSYLIMLLMSVVGLIYHIDIPFIKYLWNDYKAHRKDKTEAN